MKLGIVVSTIVKLFHSGTLIAAVLMMGLVTELFGHNNDTGSRVLHVAAV